MKVAVASSDGITVDGCFGQAGHFLIYEFHGGDPRMVEARYCQPVCAEEGSYPLDPERLDEVLTSLGDCARLFVYHIGRTAAARLRVSGIEPIVYDGPIARITANPS